MKLLGVICSRQLTLINLKLIKSDEIPSYQKVCNEVWQKVLPLEFKNNSSGKKRQI